MNFAYFQNNYFIFWKLQEKNKPSTYSISLDLSNFICLGSHIWLDVSIVCNQSDSCYNMYNLMLLHR